MVVAFCHCTKFFTSQGIPKLAIDAFLFVSVEGIAADIGNLTLDSTSMEIMSSDVDSIALNLSDAGAKLVAAEEKRIIGGTIGNNVHGGAFSAEWTCKGRCSFGPYSLRSI
jgi:hypothetical protein